MSFAVDLHTHTRHGSNCSYMEPRDLVRRAQEVGLDAVCVTEHNVPWEDAALAALTDGSPLRLFGGVEMSTEAGDVLVYGVGGAALEARLIADLRRLVDSQGGAMIAAHPFRRYSVAGVRMDAEEASRCPVLAWVDAVEVFNGLATRMEVELAQEVLSRIGLPGVAGSDSHTPQTVGSCYTVFERPLATVRDLVKEVKAGRFQAVHRGFELTF
jgi:predicted metal-dependent phosphoesterase TrpH